MTTIRLVLERKDYPTIQSGWVVRYRFPDEYYTGEVNASRDGVSICGSWPITSSKELLEHIARTLRKAYLHHRHLAPRKQHLDPLPEERVEELLKEKLHEAQAP